MEFVIDTAFLSPKQLTFVEKHINYYNEEVFFEQISTGIR